MIYDEDKKAYIEQEEKRVKVEIGDSKDPNKFHPRLKLKGWDNEVNVSFGLVVGDDEEPTVTESDGVVEWVTSKIKAKFYNLYDIEETGHEFEIWLLEKPSTNVVTLSMNDPKELEFYYQPELSEDEINSGCERPDNVVGSYAVYHKTCGNLHTSEAIAEKYKSGKAFHIYRPWAEDRGGARVWCELYIDPENHVTTITIPEYFYNSAIYPVLIDPTFGYTTAGSSNASWGYYGPYMFGASLTEAGSLTSITANARPSSSGSATGYVYGIYNGDKTFNEHTNEGSGTSTSYSWLTLNFASAVSLSAGSYYLSGRCNSTSTSPGIKYDTGFSGTEYYYDDTSYSATNWPSPFVADYTATNRKLSIYGTYTAAATPPTINILSYSATRISDESGKTTCTIAFSANMDILEWEARAGGTGQGLGLLVGSGNSTVTAGSSVNFDVDYSELTNGDGDYRINVYGRSAGGWTPYG